jgi:predicted DNA-binding transcriptional regulator YafY
MHNQHKILRVLQLITLLKKEPAKSIRFLAGVLESTDRTVYRYLDLVKELGFELHKDHNNKFQIVGGDEYQQISFSNEEVLLLRDLVMTTGKDNKLRDSLLQKIYLQSELAIQGNQILKANLGKMVEKINSSISENKRIVLKGYHSLNTQKISDRIIEPITLTDNYNSVCGFEVETQLNKYYNLERITEVIQLEEEQQFHQLHQLDEMDVFGFSEKNGQKFSVELLVSLRAYILLKEQYPKIDNYITKEINTEKYRVKIDVNNPKPITRFLLGLKEDIEVVGSESFLKHLSEID